MFNDIGEDLVPDVDAPHPNRWLYPVVDLANEFGPPPNPGAAEHDCLVNCSDMAVKGVRFVQAHHQFNAGGLDDDVETAKRVERGDVVLVREDGQDLDDDVFEVRVLVFSGANALALARAEKKRLFDKSIQDDRDEQLEREEYELTVISDWDKIIKLYKSSWGGILSKNTSKHVMRFCDSPCKTPRALSCA